MIASLEDRILQRCNQTLRLVHPRCRCEISSTETTDAKVHDSTILTTVFTLQMTASITDVLGLGSQLKGENKKKMDQKLEHVQKISEVHYWAAFLIWGFTTSPQWPVLKKSSWKTPESFVRIPLHPKPRVWVVSWHLKQGLPCRFVRPVFKASTSGHCNVMLVDMTVFGGRISCDISKRFEFVFHKILSLLWVNWCI